VTPVVFAEEARTDALEAFGWYEEQRTGLGLVFREALDAAMERISREPGSFRIQSDTSVEFLSNVSRMLFSIASIQILYSSLQSCTDVATHEFGRAAADTCAHVTGPELPSSSDAIMQTRKDAFARCRSTAAWFFVIPKSSATSSPGRSSSIRSVTTAR
jgi:hypothetical protein